MGNVTLQKFYPDNGTSSAADVNANYNAIAGSTQGLNDENFSSQAFEREHFNMTGLVIQDARIQANGYTKGLGTTLDAAAKYRAATDSTIGSGTDNCTRFSDLVHRINHDANGTASNNYGEALNLAVGGPDGSGGSNGLQIPAGSVIHVFWNLNIWRFSPDTDIAGESVTNRREYFSRLISGVATDKNGVGLYSMIAYPKFSTSTATPIQDSHFQRADEIGFSTDTFMDPPDGVAQSGGGATTIDPATSGNNNKKAFADARNDHWTWIPTLVGTATDGAGVNPIMIVMDGEQGNQLDDETLGGPLNVTGETFIKTTSNVTLTGISMFVSGLYTTSYDTSAGKNCVILEDQCHENDDGGVDGRIEIERGQVGYVIYRPEGV